MEWDTDRQHYICIGIKIYKIEAVLNIDEFVSIHKAKLLNSFVLWKTRKFNVTGLVTISADHKPQF